MAAEAIVGLREDEGGVEDGEEGGESAVDVVFAERWVELDPDEDADQVGEEGVDRAGDGGDDDVGCALREVEGGH